MLESLLIELCNYELFGIHPAREHFESVTKEQWLSILDLATMQGILPVVIDALEHIRPDYETALADIRYQYLGAVIQSENRYNTRIQNMTDMALMFGKENINVMFLKGASLAAYYPQPSHRVSSDIDYYLFGRTKDGDRILLDHGLDVNPYFHHHTQSSMRGMLLENHYDFLNRKDHHGNLILDDALKELADKEGRSVPFIIDSHSEISNTFCMTPTMNALFLMRHMLGHFASETVILRQLYDWALFLKKDSAKVDWEYVGDLYSKSGMNRFSNMVSLILARHMKVAVEYPFEVFPDELEERVWESIIHPVALDKFRKYSFKYYLHEFRTFFNNRWKHKLCYPEENYLGLLFGYGWSHVKRSFGLLK